MKLFRRLRALLRRRHTETEMAEELRLHLELQARAHVARGLSPGEAHDAALREFGGVEQVKERCRDQRLRGLVALEQSMQDVRYALRSLRRNPGFTLAVVLTLALGIGANATIFSVVNAVLLEPPPYAAIDRLVSLRETRPEAGGSGKRVAVPVSPATVFDWRNAVTTVEQIAVGAPTEFTLTGTGEPEILSGAAISAEFFPMLGVSPVLGRHFRAEESKPGAPGVAVLSHAFWQRRFGGDAAILGKVLTLDGNAVTVVGVLPAWFDGGAAAGVMRRSRPDAWVPLVLVEAGAARSVPAFELHAKLKPGATREQLQGEVDAVMQRLAKDFPATNAARGAVVEMLADRIVGDVRSSLWVLFAAVVCVLVIACANVANLLLARATQRSAETAMRAALGASRGRLVRQFLTESVLLSGFGCVLGLALVYFSVDALAAILPATVPRAEHIAVDGRVLTFTVGISLLTGLAFGLLPAWLGARTDLQAAIKTGGRGGKGGRAGARARSGLVVAQVSVSLVLLVGAGLLLKSFLALLNVDPGFNPHNVLTLRVSLPGGEKYRSSDKRTAFFDQLDERIGALPGVDATALVFPLPFSGPIQNRAFSVPGRPVDLSAELASQLNVVSPDYFRALGIRVTRGRVFTAQDRANTPLVAMVNETLAQRIWPGEDPVGKRLAVGPGASAQEREVIGVFADIKQRELNAGPLNHICVPYAQQPARTLYLAVRGGVEASSLLPLVREQLKQLDPDLPPTDLALWAERLRDSVAPRRMTTWLLASFAAMALLLAVIGLYGVMSYVVAQRTREFGIRMALGARLRDMLRLVVGQGMRLVFLGLALGVATSLALTRAISGQLYGVEATDPSTFAAVALLLAAVGAAACWLPARRAARVDPMTALRAE